jgi:hypothetical protein
MSWLSAAVKKIGKIQPGKLAVSAANTIATTLPVVGGIVGSVEGAVAQAQANRAAAKGGTAGAGGTWAQVTDTLGNANQAAKTVSSTTKYILIGVGAIVLILIIVMMMRKK